MADFRKLSNEPSDLIKYVECFSLFELVLAALHGPLFVNPCLKERLSAEH